MSVSSDLSQLVPITAAIALQSTTGDMLERKKVIRRRAELADTQLNTFYAYLEINESEKRNMSSD